jgi:predicted esterase
MLRILIPLAALLCSCTTLDTRSHAQQMAQAAGMQKSAITTDGFVLAAYSRLTDTSQPVNVYIEGDGLAWLSRHQLSSDPTPRQAIGLALAARDPSPNVVYLARPCQFNDFDRTPCASTYWSDKRFSEEVISAMNHAVETFAQQLPGQDIHLIGYSGGAAVAALIAARRHDIASLRTVAGNLDHVALNALHQVSPMPDSLNAIDAAPKLATLPQLHFIGGQDQVIPELIAQRFLTAVGNRCAQVITQADASHTEGWIEHWPHLLKINTKCSTND